MDFFLYLCAKLCKWEIEARIKASNKSEYKEEKIKITGYIHRIYKIGWNTIYHRPA